jgi:hypothetical protein
LRYLVSHDFPAVGHRMPGGSRHGRTRSPPARRGRRRGHRVPRI